jgi:formylglycine-generating enzyme required for sulfatase activity
MVVAPAGRFTMGSPAGEPERESVNGGSEDQLAVTIAKPFAVGRFAVTRGEFAAFVQDSGHKTDGGCWAFTGTEWKQWADRNWHSPGFTQNDRHPVVCVNWDDAKAFAAWALINNGHDLPAVVGGRARVRCTGRQDDAVLVGLLHYTETGDLR